MQSYYSAIRDFHRARRRAALEQIIARFTGKSADLLSYDEVRKQLRAAGQAQRGLQEIPLDAIVGSVGRYTAYGSAVQPGHQPTHAGGGILPMIARPDNWWDCKSVGSNGVPIETEHGWLLINHAYDHDHIYRLGVVLLDLDDPTRVVRRPTEPIFWPEELWELRGDVPNVVFSCANPVVDGTVYVYYGGGDSVIGLATCRLDDLLTFALEQR